MHKRHRDCKGTVLAADLEELIKRDPSRPLRSLVQEMSILQNNCANDGVRGLEMQSLCYENGMKPGPIMSEASKTMLNRLKERLSEVREQKIWPPSSPDCKPLDYFVCGVSKFWVNAKPHNKTAYLISKIMEMMGFLDRDTVAKAIRRFRPSSEAVVAAEGHFIE